MENARKRNPTRQCRTLGKDGHAGERVMQPRPVLLWRYRDRTLNLDNRRLLAREEIEESQVRQRKASPSLFLSGGAMHCPIGTGRESGESRTPKQDSQCRNEPNERRHEDQEALGLISVLKTRRQHPFPEWVPFQQIQDPAVCEEDYGNAAYFLDEERRLSCRPLEEKPNRERRGEEERPRRHTALLGINLTPFRELWQTAGKQRPRSVFGAMRPLHHPVQRDPRGLTLSSNPHAFLLLFGRRLRDQCFLLLLVHLGQFPLQLHQFP